MDVSFVSFEQPIEGHGFTEYVRISSCHERIRSTIVQYKLSATYATDYSDILKFMLSVIGASLSKLHSNVENGTVVHVRRTVVKSKITIHYYSLVQWFMYKKTR